MRRVRSSERGETLLELLVAISIMSVAVVTIVGAIAVSIRLSDVHRRQTIARGYLTAFAEAVQASVAATPTGYKTCAASNVANYESLYTVSTPYVRNVVSVDYWNLTTQLWTALAGCASDSGVQRLTLRVRADTGTVVDEKIQIVIRRPCRPGDTPACA